MEEFRVCPTCKYDKGFHTSYKKVEQDFKIIHICPNCGSRYDIGLIEERLEKLEPKKIE
jgi:ssDNA-binding Zn-finger/Zn-ribbon topoisomerase 1